MDFEILDPTAVAADFDEKRLRWEFDLARKSLRQYKGKGGDLTLVQANSKAVVWRVEGPEGPRALKWMGLRRQKAVFSLLAHRHMEKQLFPVPHIFPTKEGHLFVTSGQRLGFLAEWVQGRPIARDVDDEWRLFMRTLAEFHRRSRGMKVPPNVRTKTKLGGWPLDYHAKIGRLRLWYEEAGRRKNQPYFALYRELAPQIIDRAQRLLDRLVASYYWSWVEGFVRDPCLCHSDFGESNTVLTPEGDLYVIDLDTVSRDLPVRDLRKVFESYLDPSADLAAALHRVIEPYAAYRPLTPEQLDVFLIDVQFPYKFYRTARRAFVYNELDEVALQQEAQLDLARAKAVQRYRQQYS